MSEEAKPDEQELLSDKQIDKLADKLAEKQFEKFALFVGKSVLTKLFYIVVVCAVGVVAAWKYWTGGHT